MNDWIVAAAKQGSGLELQLGWMGLIIPVAIAAITAIVRAFTAESRVLKDCGDDVAEVRDGIHTERVRPALASLIVRIQPYVDFSKKRFLAGEPGDPEIETGRVLSSNPKFFDSYTELESHYAVIAGAQSVHDRRVGHVKRIGCAAAVFLVAWAYFGFWLCMPKLGLPVPASLVALAVLAASLGWIGAEALGSVRESNHLSGLARQARNTGGSTR